MPPHDRTSPATLRRLGDVTAGTRHPPAGWTPAPGPRPQAPPAPDPMPDGSNDPLPPTVPVPVPVPARDLGPPGSAPTSHGPDDRTGQDLTSRTERALQTARTGYARAHGHPLDRAPHVVRRRVRWAVPWRLAGAAGVVLLVVAGAVTLRATTTAPGAPVALPTPAPAGSAAGDAPADPQAAGSGGTAGSTAGSTPGPDVSTGVAAALVVVHVVGAVVAPGVVRLPTGSRVVDALATAGGAAPDADLASLNLARVLVDGEQVVVLRPGESGPAAAPPAAEGGAPGLVDLNTADAAALDGLPGIGPVLAQRIVEHRDERPFASVDELGDVPGIGPTLLERLRPLVSA